MQEKHKVTLYLPPDLHRQLKIRAAVDAEPMSAIAQRAIVFYLNHSEVVEEVETAHGRVHQIYSCPECTNALVIRDGEMVTLGEQPSLLADEELSVNKVKGNTSSDQPGEQELVSV
jgi:hypothetical protein